MCTHFSWFGKVSKTGVFHTPSPCSITQFIWWPDSGWPLTERSHLVIKDNSRHTKVSRCARQSGSGAEGSLHVLKNTGPSHHHPRHFNSPESLWMPTFVDSSCGFTKQEFWLNHGPVRTVPTLSVLSSPQSYKKNKPLSTPPRIPLSTGSTARFSSLCLWLVSPPRKDSKSKSCRRPGPWTKTTIKYEW